MYYGIEVTEICRGRWSARVILAPLSVLFNEPSGHVVKQRRISRAIYRKTPGDVERPISCSCTGGALAACVRATDATDHIVTGNFEIHGPSYYLERLQSPAT